MEWPAVFVMVPTRHLEGLLAIARDVGDGQCRIDQVLETPRGSARPF